MQYDARYTQRHINTLQYDARHTQRHINTLQYDARYTQRHINTLQYDARHTQRHINTLQYDTRYTQRQIKRPLFLVYASKTHVQKSAELLSILEYDHHPCSYCGKSFKYLPNPLLYICLNKN